MPRPNSQGSNGERTREALTLQGARYAALTSRAVTDQARDAVDALAEALAEDELKRKQRKNKRGPEAAQRFRDALEGFLGDMLLAMTSERAQGWVYRSTRPESFTAQDIGHRDFTSVTDAMKSLGLITRKAGFRRWLVGGFEPGDPNLPLRDLATRFRATPELMERMEGYGIHLDNVSDHFIVALPKKPLQLRAKATRNEWFEKVRGKPMKFEETNWTKFREDQVRRLNEFFDRFELRGGTHRGYIRVFNMGDQPDFDWDKGGRLYSQGDGNYQQLPKQERLAMTINGEPVCEIDIRASYMTIYHAKYRAPFDPREDPYDLQGLDRDIVKIWVVATFGNNAPIEKWPREISAKYKEEHGRPLGKVVRAKDVYRKIAEVFPMMELWGAHGLGWADLMFIESEAIIRTMLELMEHHSVPSLSVHDSLIVPASQESLATRILGEKYLMEAKVRPVLVAHRLDREMAA
jgi:hypothetical protein